MKNDASMKIEKLEMGYLTTPFRNSCSYRNCRIKHKSFSNNICSIHSSTLTYYEQS
jgi:hypothetical protein